MAEFKHFNELKVEEVIRCKLGVVIDIDLAVMLHSSLHKQIGAFEGRTDIYNFFAVKSTNDALVGVACCNAYVDRRFNERVIFHHEHVSSTCLNTCLPQTEHIVPLLLLFDINFLITT